ILLFCLYDAHLMIDTLSLHDALPILLRGAASDPLDSYADSDRGMVGDKSQWNKLILPLHEHAKTGNWVYKQYAGDVEYWGFDLRSEEHTSELQSRFDLVCRLLLEKKK